MIADGMIIVCHAELERTLAIADQAATRVHLHAN